MRRYLGIDYGAKRIGLSRGDDIARRAYAEATVGSLAEIAEYIAENGPFDVAVIGLPRNIEGEETAQTAAARAFAIQAEHELNLPIRLQDEFDTSNVARERLEASGRKYVPSWIDAEAAAIILQDYLDTLA